MIGAIGSKELDDVIMFEVSPEKILTFDNFVRRNSVRFAEHNTLQRKPVTQYVGPALDIIDLKIILKAQWGVNPQNEFNKLIRLQRDGATLSIVVGKSAFGMYRWTITNLGIPHNKIDNKGIIMSSTVNVSFKEYIAQPVFEIPRQINIPSPPPEPLQRGNSVILNGPVYRDSFGEGRGRTFSNHRDTITIIAPTTRTAPYHIGGIGWAKPSDITRG